MFLLMVTKRRYEKSEILHTLQSLSQSNNFAVLSHFGDSFSVGDDSTGTDERTYKVFGSALPNPKREFRS